MGSGWKFTPFYHKCPRCQLDFSKHFIDSGEYKKHAENIETYTKLATLTGVAVTHKQAKDSRDDNHPSPCVSKRAAAYERLLSISSDKSISRKPLTRQEVQELKEIWEDLHDYEDPVVRLYRWVLSKISKKRTVSTPGEKG